MATAMAVGQLFCGCWWKEKIGKERRKGKEKEKGRSIVWLRELFRNYIDFWII